LRQEHLGLGCLSVVVVVIKFDYSEEII